MRASTIIAIGASTLAAAAPTSLSTRSTSDRAFEVTNFVFGCSAACYWNFDLAVKGNGTNHPAVTNPVHCAGSLDGNTDYVECGAVSDTQSLYAYIVKATNELKLQYEVTVPSQGAYYKYFGETEVYSATGSDADKQKPDFSVPETRAIAVA